MVKKTLVLGASLKSDRYSNMAIKKLSIKGNEVLAIGLKAGKVGNIQIHEKLSSFKNIHTITLYINNKRQKEYYDYIISLNPKRVIFNPGSENIELYKLLDKESIDYIEACTLVLLSTNQY
tara:strand:+ start:26 stop:388 length:363 start_codon:yes stop_codon:yes gene_type:complete